MMFLVGPSISSRYSDDPSIRVGHRKALFLALGTGLSAALTTSREWPIRQLRKADAYLPRKGSPQARRPTSWCSSVPAVLWCGLRPSQAGLAIAGDTIGKEDLHAHELRHTAASLAIAGGADMQTMLGHQSDTMTWDLNGHRYPNRLQEVAEAPDPRARTKSVQQTRRSPSSGPALRSTQRP